MFVAQHQRAASHRKEKREKEKKMPSKVEQKWHRIGQNAPASRSFQTVHHRTRMAGGESEHIDYHNSEWAIELPILRSHTSLQEREVSTRG